MLWNTEHCATLPWIACVGLRDAKFGLLFEREALVTPRCRAASVTDTFPKYSRST
jgi:hypothetical protein